MVSLGTNVPRLKPITNLDTNKMALPSGLMRVDSFSSDRRGFIGKENEFNYELFGDQLIVHNHMSTGKLLTGKQQANIWTVVVIFFSNRLHEGIHRVATPL